MTHAQMRGLRKGDTVSVNHMPGLMDPLILTVIGTNYATNTVICRDSTNSIYYTEPRFVELSEKSDRRPEAFNCDK